MCLRVASACRTVLHDAVCVITGMMPVLIVEDIGCFAMRNTIGAYVTTRLISMFKKHVRGIVPPKEGGPTA